MLRFFLISLISLNSYSATWDELVYSIKKQEEPINEEARPIITHSKKKEIKPKAKLNNSIGSMSGQILAEKKVEKTHTDESLRPSKIEDDFVFFSYDGNAKKPEEDKQNSIAEVNRDISSNIEDIIKREFADFNKKRKDRAFSIQDSINLALSSIQKSKGESKAMIELFKVEIELGHEESIKNYEVLNKNKNEIIKSDENGVTVFEGNINSPYSVVSLEINKFGFLKHFIDLPVKVKNDVTAIPLISTESLEKILNDYDINVPGGFLLIRLPGLSDKVEIDHEYAYKLYLSENFEIVKNIEQSNYVLFLKVSPGNTLITHYLSDGSITDKIVFLQDESIYIDYSDIRFVGNQVFKLNEERFFNKNSVPIDVIEDNFGKFNTAENATKRSINEYEVALGYGFDNYKPYLELNYDDGYFIGMNTLNKNIDIPGKYFLNQIKEDIGATNSNEQCLIQVNLPKGKQVINVVDNFETEKGAGYLKLGILNKDGLIDDTITPIAEKLFFMGAEEGALRLFIEYSDFTQDYIQSFCSLNTYLLEQF